MAWVFQILPRQLKKKNDNVNERKLFIHLLLGTMTQPTIKSAFESVLEQGLNFARRVGGVGEVGGVCRIMVKFKS